MTDLAVIGGGPAAAAAALHLARGGADVDLYAPPAAGEKPCGGALPEHLLPRLPGFDPAPLPSVEVSTIELTTAAGLACSVAIRGLRIFRRADLDAALVEVAQSAGARRRREKVRRIEWRDGSPVLTTASSARTYRWVVDAGGARSVGRLALGLEPIGESLGLGASLPAASFGGEVAGDGSRRRSVVLSFPDAADSYCWIFPRPGGVSVGIAFSAGSLSRGAARSLLDDFLRRRLSGWSGDLPAAYCYPIPVFSARSLEAVAASAERGLLLAGDAAAVADPLTREGIRWAALSGTWAAESLLDGRPDGYVERLRQELEPEMTRAQRAVEIFFEDRLVQWMIPLCRWHGGLAAVLIDLLTCRLPYRQLRRRLIRAVIGGGRRG